MSAIIPIPRIAISVRPGTMDDLPFIDALQKKHTKMVGWMPTKQLEGKIGLGQVLIADEGLGLGSGLGGTAYTLRRSSVTEATYLYERLRAPAAGILEAGATTFLLLIALRLGVVISTLATLLGRHAGRCGSVLLRQSAR